MAYLRNNSVNLLNLHYGIASLAMAGGGVFYLVYLLKAGVKAPIVLTALALILAGRFVLRPTVLALAKPFGMKPLVVFGTLACAFQYPLLAEVHGVGWALWVLCVVSAVGDTFYWTTYHAYFASLGDSEHRGHQVGAREALAATMGIAGPLIGGWALTALGPRAAFAIFALVQTTAALPLLGTPNVAIRAQLPGAFRASLGGAMIFAADGWITAGYTFTWQMVLFLSLGGSFSAYGGAMALAALVGAASGLILGRLIDAGHGYRALWVALALLAVVILLRSAAAGNATLAVIANAFGALEACLYMPTIMTAVYNQAKRSPCALRFHIAAEGGWDLGCAAGCIITAILTSAGAPLSMGIILALAGVLPMFALLRRHYVVVGEEAIARAAAQ